MTPDELIAALTAPPSVMPEDGALTIVPGFFVHRADLTPGKRNEGGLHANTYNSDRKREGSAGFFPLDDELNPVVNYVPVHGNDEEYERRRAREWEENFELIAKVIVHLVEVAPYAKRFWHEQAAARRAKKEARKAVEAAANQPVVVEATVVDSGRELAVAEEVHRKDMSSAEARARCLAAIRARAFSDEQMKLVSNANIVDGESAAELQRTLTELPPQPVKGITEAVAANPSVLSGDLLAELGTLLGLDRAEPEAVPIEQRRAQ